MVLYPPLPVRLDSGPFVRHGQLSMVHLHNSALVLNAQVKPNIRGKPYWQTLPAFGNNKPGAAHHWGCPRFKPALRTYDLSVPESFNSTVQEYRSFPLLLYLVNRALDFVQPGGPVYEQGPARRQRVHCRRCGTVYSFVPQQGLGSSVHSPHGSQEYHCEACKPTRKGRLFKRPDLDDHERYEQARLQLLQESGLPVPDDEIPM